MHLLLVCLGGALGAGARYAVTGWTLRLCGSSFPFGTLAVNLAGSFLIGFVMEIALVTGSLSPALRAALVFGVLGGFTTFSAFSYETASLLRSQAFGLGLLNAALQLIGCLAATFLGLGAASLLRFR